MAIQPQTVRQFSRDPVLDAATAIGEVSIELRDWKRTHRAISDERREAARDYVSAIIHHDVLLRSATPEEQQAFADRLWRRFRDVYDDLRHGEQEDFVRALARM